MTTKHLPGPWRTAEEHTFIVKVTVDDQKPIAMMRGWGWLTKEYGDKEAIAIQRANANLIARAPELLDENERLRVRVKQLEDVAKELYMNEFGGNSTSFEDAVRRSVKTEEYEQRIIKIINPSI